MARRWRRRLRIVTEILTISAAVAAIGFWWSVPNTARLETENPKSTAFIDLRLEQAEAQGSKLDLKWQWRPIGKISRYLRAAVVYSEDANFYTHDGVDWSAIEDAFEKDVGGAKLKVGGSTITQQVAKNLYLSPQRSIARKAREMLIAFSLEDHLSKQRILELYLNVAEWGHGVFGAEAAARKWFGHSAQSLAPAEAARLAIALPNPIDRAPNKSSPDLTKKAVRIIRLFRMQGLIDAAQERTALDEVGAAEERVLPEAPSAAQASGLRPQTSGSEQKPNPQPSPTPGPAPTPGPSPTPSPSPTPIPPPTPIPQSEPGPVTHPD